MIMRCLDRLDIVDTCGNITSTHLSDSSDSSDSILLMKKKEIFNKKQDQKKC